MTHLKTIIGLLVAAVAVVAFGAAQASASSAPIVIPYEKTCVGTVCSGSAGENHTGTINMQITSFRETGGGGAQLTLTEDIRLGGISFTAEMSGHLSSAGFIVLSGTVTEDSFVGAQVHQRSNFDGGNPQSTHWIGKLQLMPASG